MLSERNQKQRIISYTIQFMQNSRKGKTIETKNVSMFARDWKEESGLTAEVKRELFKVMDIFYILTVMIVI